MSEDRERDELRELRAVLAAADVDVSDLVGSAWEEAREEVRETLRRLMVHDLLRRSAAALGGAGEPPAPATAPPRPAIGATPPAPAGARPTASYLLGIGRGDRAAPRRPVPAIPGAGPVRVLSAAGVTAILCDVEVAALAGLSDPDPDSLELLADVARAHDAILAELAAEGPILPLRLGTLLPDDAAVTAVLEAHAAELTAELDRIAGHHEWAVTVHRLDAPATADDVPDGGTLSGRAYLEARRATLDARAHRRDARAQLADELHTALAATAVDADRVSARPLEDVAPPLLHGVYLVADDAVPRFDEAVDALRTEHPDALIDVSGPWPPYHFTTVDLGAGAEPVADA